MGEENPFYETGGHRIHVTITFRRIRQFSLDMLYMVTGMKQDKFC